MSSETLTHRDVQALRARGIEPGDVEAQIAVFRRGVTPVRLNRPARAGDGIVQVPPGETGGLAALHEKAAGEGRMVKFVPASGAASRMFKDWHGCYRRGTFGSAVQEETFLGDIDRFAFYDDLDRAVSSGGNDLGAWIRDRRCADILEYVLTPRGLHYAWLPKALLKFHRYPGGSRTALEEHLVEAALYVRDRKNVCRIHFTVSAEHRSLVQELLEKVQGHHEQAFGVRYEISISIQEPSTDTLAVDLQGRPFRDRDGALVFRPGGHGALLGNLDSIDGDIIFVKNIDNIVPDRLKEPTVLYKKMLGGYLVRLQEESFRHLRDLSRGQPGEGAFESMVRFCTERLLITLPGGFDRLPAAEQRGVIFGKLNRPVRVCGMVRNEGEPGGGPFWVENRDGTQSLQIVEEVQIDSRQEGQKRIWGSSTHFNPVDLVCGVRDFRGGKFDLSRFVDPETAIITKKSHEDGELLALELPGLWNGSMAFWNTVFVEVPIETFNPVKTAEDLLRPAHLPG